MKAYLRMMASVAKIKVKQLFTDEKGEVNIVAIVVLIGIAVILALAFKEKIVEILGTLFDTIDTKVNGGADGGGITSDVNFTTTP